MKRVVLNILYISLLSMFLNLSNAKAGMSGRDNVYAGINLGTLWSQSYIFGYHQFQLQLSSLSAIDEISYYVAKDAFTIAFSISPVYYSFSTRAGIEYDFFNTINIRAELGGSVNTLFSFAPEVYFGGFIYF